MPPIEHGRICVGWHPHPDRPRSRRAGVTAWKSKPRLYQTLMAAPHVLPLYYPQGQLSNQYVGPVPSEVDIPFSRNHSCRRTSRVE